MGNQHDILGKFEEKVLLAVLRLKGDAYGANIRQQVETAERLVNPQKTISIGAVYATLDRLERKGFITSRHGESTQARGGRRKRYFEVLGTGELALTEAQRVRQELRQGGFGEALPQPA